LIRVEMYENLLEKLPESIGSCSLLQMLDFADNNLTDLPQSLAKCTACQ
jgi:Leucine-rich repeat (LRR) protein